jgi:cell division protein ZapA
MVALNLARELLTLKGVEGVAPGADPAMLERVRQLKLDIDSTLSAD